MFQLLQLLIILSWSASAIAQPTFGGKLQIQQSGAVQGLTSILNCTTNVTCACSGGVCTISATGGGGGGADCTTAPTLLCLAGRTGSTNNPVISTDNDGTITGSATVGKMLHIRSDTSITDGIHMDTNALSQQRVFIGPASDPTSPLLPNGILQFLVTSNGSIGALFGAFGAGTSQGANFFGVGSRGTVASPTASQDEDTLFKITALGYDAANNLGGSGQETANMIFTAKPPGGVPVTGFVSGQIAIQTTDTTGTLATRIEIDRTGNIALGDATGNSFQVAPGGPLVSLPVRTNANEITGRFGSLWYNTDVNTFRGVVSATKVTFLTDDGSGNVTIPGDLIITKAPHFLGAPPSCGTGCSSVAGNDRAFDVTTSALATAATVNFSATLSSIPICICNDNSAASFCAPTSVSTTAVTFGLSAALTGHIYAHCFQNA